MIGPIQREWELEMKLSATTERTTNWDWEKRLSRLDNHKYRKDMVLTTDTGKCEY